MRGRIKSQLQLIRPVGDTEPYLETGYTGYEKLQNIRSYRVVFIRIRLMIRGNSENMHQTIR